MNMIYIQEHVWIFQECPRGCSNSRVVNCTQCEWPFSTVWEQSPYCDVIQLVPAENHTLTWVVIIISVATVLEQRYLLLMATWILSIVLCVCCITSDRHSFRYWYATYEIFNLTYINTSHTNGADQTATCTGLGPFSLWTTFFIFIFVVPNLEYIKYVMFDCRIKSRLNLAYPYPWYDVDEDALRVYPRT